MENVRHSDNPGWLAELRRGLGRLAAGEFDAARTHFARAHRWAPEQPEVCYAFGRELLRCGELRRAESLLRAAWAGDPTLLSCAAALARCLGIEQQRFDEAHAVLDDAAVHHPLDPAIDVVRAELFIDQGMPAQATEAAQRALGHPEVGDHGRDAARAALAHAHNLHGAHLASCGRLDQALFAFKVAADLDPDWSGPVVNMGAALDKLGNRQRALFHYQRAIAIDPTNATAHANLGRLWRKVGNHTAAITELIIAVDLAPTDADVWVELAEAHEVAGDRQQAVESLYTAIELDSSHGSATRRLSDLLTLDGRILEAAELTAVGRPAMADRLTPDDSGPKP